MDEIANVRHDPRQPWVGQTAFAHKGGMHVHAIDRVARSYEHIQPEAVGNLRRVLVSDMSGRTNILMKAKELGFKLEPDAPEPETITGAASKRLEREGYEYRGRRSLAGAADQPGAQAQGTPVLSGCLPCFHAPGRPQFCLRGHRQGARRAAEAGHTVAEGDGPVNALDKALRAALVKFYPQLKKVVLTDYKVRILESSTGTGARTRVLIQSTDGKREWGTVGVNDNIIEASLQALVDSLEYALMQK